MREETLKRLDALIEGINKLRTDPYGHDSLNWNDVWLALRAELAAARCENCQYWNAGHRCLSADVQLALGRLGREMPFTPATFCCGYFWAKKQEPTS